MISFNPCPETAKLSPLPLNPDRSPAAIDVCEEKTSERSPEEPDQSAEVQIVVSPAHFQWLTTQSEFLGVTKQEVIADVLEEWIMPKWGSYVASARPFGHGTLRSRRVHATASRRIPASRLIVTRAVMPASLRFCFGSRLGASRKSQRSDTLNRLVEIGVDVAILRLLDFFDQSRSAFRRQAPETDHNDRAG